MVDRDVDLRDDALGPMWAAHRDGVRRLLISLTRDIDLADDLLQETYLYARDGISGYRGGDARAWLAAIARNAHRMHVRQRYVRSEIPLDTHEQTDAGDPPSVDRHDLLAIREALSALSPTLRTALLMKHYAGCTYQEIARQQNCPVGTAKWRVSEALGRLRLVLLTEGRTEMADSAEAHGINLVDYAYGVLPEVEAARVRAHLAACDRCRREAEELKRVASLLDAMEGDRKQMHFVELDQEGLIALYAHTSWVFHSDGDAEVLPKWEFASSGMAPDHAYINGEEVAFTRIEDWRPEHGESVPRYAISLKRPVRAEEPVFSLLVYLPKPDGPHAGKLDDGGFRVHWNQNPGSNDEFAYVQAIRLPSGARLLTAEPQPDEIRGNGAITLVWRRVLPPMQAFECTVEYRLEDRVGETG